MRTPAPNTSSDASAPSATRSAGPIQPRFTARTKKKTTPSNVTTPPAQARARAPRRSASSTCGSVSSRFHTDGSFGAGAGAGFGGGGAQARWLAAEGGAGAAAGAGAGARGASTAARSSRTSEWMASSRRSRSSSWARTLFVTSGSSSGPGAEVDYEIAVERLGDLEQGVDPRRAAAGLEPGNGRLG